MELELNMHIKVKAMVRLPLVYMLLMRYMLLQVKAIVMLVILLTSSCRRWTSRY